MLVSNMYGSRRRGQREGEDWISLAGCFCLCLNVYGLQIQADKADKGNRSNSMSEDKLLGLSCLCVQSVCVSTSLSRSQTAAPCLLTELSLTQRASPSLTVTMATASTGPSQTVTSSEVHSSDTLT